MLLTTLKLLKYCLGCLQIWSIPIIKWDPNLWWGPREVRGRLCWTLESGLPSLVCQKRGIQFYSSLSVSTCTYSEDPLLCKCLLPLLLESHTLKRDLSILKFDLCIERNLLVSLWLITLLVLKPCKANGSQISYCLPLYILGHGIGRESWYV